MEAAILAPDDFMSIGLEMVGFNRSYCVKSYTVTPPLGEPHISCDYFSMHVGYLDLYLEKNSSLYLEKNSSLNIEKNSSLNRRFFSKFREEFFSIFREEFFSIFREENQVCILKMLEFAL